MGVARLRLAATSVMLAAAGLLTVAAGAQRWWPACRWGSFDAGACIRVQDDSYDHTLPLDPTVPIGTAAQLQGAALLVLAAAVVLLPTVLAGRSAGRILHLAAVVVSVGVAVVGVASWRTGPLGEGSSSPWLQLGGALWLLGLPVLVLVAVAAAPESRRRVEAGRWGVAAFLVAANPVLTTLYLAPVLLGYTSHDTTPWTEAVTGASLLGAALCLWPAAYPERSDEAPRTEQSLQPRAG